MKYYIVQFNVELREVYDVESFSESEYLDAVARFREIVEYAECENIDEAVAENYYEGGGYIVELKYC